MGSDLASDWCPSLDERPYLGACSGHAGPHVREMSFPDVTVSVVKIADDAHRQKDLEARARSAAAFAAIFTALAGAGFAGVLPKTVAVLAACLAVAGLIAAFLFTVEARNAGVQLTDAEAERARVELGRRAPVAAVQQIDRRRSESMRRRRTSCPAGRSRRTLREMWMRTFVGLWRQRLTAAVAGSSW